MTNETVSQARAGTAPRPEGVGVNVSPLRLRLMGFALLCALPALLLPLARLGNEDERIRQQALATAEASAMALESHLRQLLGSPEARGAALAGILDEVGNTPLPAAGQDHESPPAGSIPVMLSVFNDSGVLLLRSPDTADIQPGRDFSDSALFRHAQKRQPGHVEIAGLDGRTRDYQFRRLNFQGHPGLWITSGVDVEQLQAAAWRVRLREMGAVLLLVASVVLLAAFAGGPLVLARLRKLQAVAGAVAAGQRASRIALEWHDDLRPVEVAFNQMLDALEAERAKLQDSEARYRLLFEHNLDGVLLTKPSGAILDANEAACRILGRTVEELRQRGRENLVDPSDDRWGTLLRRRGDTGAAQGELRFLRPDGSAFEVEIASSLFQDDTGQTCASTVVRDLSELTRTRAQLEQLNSHLELTVEQRTADLARAVSDLEGFAYSVSHDLRGPLRTMGGFAGALQARYGSALPEQAAHYLARIQAGARRMEALINDLLEFCRLGRQDLQLRDCDTDAIVQEVLGDLSAGTPDWSGEVRVASLPRCQADPALLRQLWENLIGNAYKYSSRKPHPRIEIGAERLEGQPVFYVRDNGAGFDMAHASRLFTVFQRLHTDTEFEGTGVGLALVKRIVERHGGRVWATAAVGDGATFFFILGTSPEKEQA